METITKSITWNELIVTDADGQIVGTLGDVVRSCPANLDNAVIQGGRIAEWEGYFLNAEGEDANWDTPRADVDWTGFEAKLNEVRG